MARSTTRNSAWPATSRSPTSTCRPPRASAPTLSGDYDRDGKTDLAFWQPKISEASSQARLKISFSGTGFTSVQGFNFGLENDLPLGPVKRDGDGQLDFAVWRPSNGTWYYLLNPRSNWTSGYAEVQWGTPGDVPVQGFDLDHDHLDDEVVWRPAGSGTTLFFRSSTTGAFNSVAVGNPGDIPFFGPDENADGRPSSTCFARPALRPGATSSSRPQVQGLPRRARSSRACATPTSSCDPTWGSGRSR
ncbi:MAG: hypothetical protein ABI867_18920 [Kofleriaceae bacterium]